MPTRTRRSSSTGSAKPAGTSWDFSKEEGGGAGKRYREGDYLVQVIKVKPVTSEEKGTPGIEVTFKFLEGKYKGETFTDRLWNTPKSLWRMRSLIEAVGEGVPAKAADWKVIGKLVIKKEVVVTLSDDEYDGRIRSRVSDFLDPEDVDPDEDDDDDLDDDDDDDLDDDDADDDDADDDDGDDDDEPEPWDKASLTELDKAELKEAAEEFEVEFPKRLTEAGKARVIKAILKAQDEDADDDVDDEDDEPEPEPEPAPRRGRRKKAEPKPAARGRRSRKPAADDDDDLEDLNLDDL